MIDAVFQQAPFDYKNALKRIKDIAKEAEQRIKRMPGCYYAKCNRCGHNQLGIARVSDGQFICVQCLIKDEVERRFKEAD